MKLTEAEVKADRVTYDEDDRTRCVCVHESMATTLGLTECQG